MIKARFKALANANLVICLQFSKKNKFASTI